MSTFRWLGGGGIGGANGYLKEVKDVYLSGGLNLSNEWESSETDWSKFSFSSSKIPGIFENI